MFNTAKNNNNNKTVHVRKLIIEWQQVKLERTSENMASYEKGKPLDRYALSSEQCPQKRKKHKSFTLDLALD